MKHRIVHPLRAVMTVSAMMIVAISAAAWGTAAYAAVTTRYVGAAVGGDTGCADPGYTSVEAAVNAASPGDIVYLCGTTPFAEQVVISKSLTLTGDPGATIAAPNPWVASADAIPPQFAGDHLFVPQAIIMIWGSGVHVSMRGLTVTGPLPGNGGCAEQEFGILVIDGATANVAGDKVTNIQDINSTLDGCQFGVGILVGREYWPASDFSAFLVEDFTGTASITGTTVAGYQKGGIVIDGPGSSASVSDNTITGAGPYSALGQIIAQNGIQVSRGAAGSVAHNTVSDNQYSGTGFAADGGILVYGGCGDPLTTHVAVVGNTLSNNDVGVYLSNADPTCSVPPGTKTQDSATNNKISSDVVTNVSGFSGSPLCGYQAGVSDFGNHDAINNNDVSGGGYLNHPSCAAAEPYVTFAIDTTGSAASRVHNNR